MTNTSSIAARTSNAQRAIFVSIVSSLIALASPAAADAPAVDSPADDRVVIHHSAHTPVWSHIGTGQVEATTVPEVEAPPSPGVFFNVNDPSEGDRLLDCTLCERPWLFVALSVGVEVDWERLTLSQPRAVVAHSERIDLFGFSARRNVAADPMPTAVQTVPPMPVQGTVPFNNVRSPRAGQSVLPCLWVFGSCEKPTLVEISW